MFLSYLISIEGELGCTGNHCSLPHTGESCCVLPASTAASSRGRGSPCSGCGAVTFLLPQHKAPVPTEHHPLVAQRGSKLLPPDVLAGSNSSQPRRRTGAALPTCHPASPRWQDPRHKLNTSPSPGASPLAFPHTRF